MAVNKRAFNPGEFAVTWISRLFIWFVIVLTVIPLLYVATASFDSSQQSFSASLIPLHLSFTNYVALFKSQYIVWIRNSTLVGVVVATAQLVMTSTAAYAFSRMKFYGRKYGLMTLILLQMFPNFMAISAIYAVLAQWGLLDNLWVYMLVLMGAGAFGIWLTKGYFDTIPKELDEAAVMDGAGHFQIFFRIILPLARPMLAVIFFLSIIGQYSEYILAGTILQSPQNYTLGMGMYGMVNNQFATQQWGVFAAGALVSAIPLTVAYMLLQPMIAKGLTAGSVKG